MPAPSAQPQLDLAATAAQPANNSPLHQPVLDKTGKVAAPLEAHTQKPDAPPLRSAMAPASQPRTGVIPDSAYDRLTVDEQAGFSRLRGPDGEPQWVKRDQLAADSGINQQQQQVGDGTTAPTDKIKIGDMEVTQAELQEFFTSKADAELRKATLPDAPEKYEAKLPDNFEMPDGIKVEFNEGDPLLTGTRKWAHAKGLSQSEFSDLVGMYASSKAQEAAQTRTAINAEIAKMGANGSQRVDALHTWLRGMVGDKLGGQMGAMLVTAGIVKGLETIQQKFSSQGAASFSQAHREPPVAPGARSPEEVSQMTSAQKLDYNRNFDQSKMPAWRDPRSS